MKFVLFFPLFFFLLLPLSTSTPTLDGYCPKPKQSVAPSPLPIAVFVLCYPPCSIVISFFSVALGCHCRCYLQVASPPCSITNTSLSLVAVDVGVVLADAVHLLHRLNSPLPPGFTSISHHHLPSVLKKPILSVSSAAPKVKLVLTITCDTHLFGKQHQKSFPRLPWLA